MVAQAVGDGARHHRVPEHLRPRAHPDVRGHYGRPPLVAPRHQLERQVRPLLVDARVPDLVHDQRGEVRVEAHPALERALLGRPLEVADGPLAVDEVRELARPHRLDAERDRYVGLADARAADEDHVLPPLQEERL